MSYEEKGAWVYLVVSAGTYAAYVIIILGRANGVPLAEVPYASTILWAIGIAIAVSIVGRILLEIAKPSDTHKGDVRDKEVHRFGEYIGGLVLAIGMVVPFGLALMQAKHFWIANAIYAVFVLSALVGTTTKLIAYRRGL
jgi:hypothetical protein